MLKYVDTDIVFQEIPDEVTLAINISNCPCKCKNCHSAYLADDIGDYLDWEAIDDLINKNKGITCVAFMGGDSDPRGINTRAEAIKNVFPELKVAWYSGRQELSPDIRLKNFNFIKLGPYIEELGGLKSTKTNQRLYEVVMTREIDENGDPVYALEDITFNFWRIC